MNFLYSFIMITLKSRRNTVMSHSVLINSLAIKTAHISRVTRKTIQNKKALHDIGLFACYQFIVFPIPEKYYNVSNKTGSTMYHLSALKFYCLSSSVLFTKSYPIQTERWIFANVNSTQQRFLERSTFVTIP